jgi:hypothetical protein
VLIITVFYGGKLMKNRVKAYLAVVIYTVENKKRAFTTSRQDKE